MAVAMPFSRLQRIDAGTRRISYQTPNSDRFWVQIVNMPIDLIIRRMNIRRFYWCMQVLDGF